MNTIIKSLTQLSDPVRAKNLSRFFKTGPGEYGEGDIFLGITVPQIRSFIRDYYHISLDDLQKLISSKYHEARMAGVLIHDKKYTRAKDEDAKLELINFYLENIQYINNWDLVDLSCHYALGEWLIDKPRLILYKFAESDDLWIRRVAIMTTFAFIRIHQFDDTMNICDMLIGDQHDLIHKATGWMLREIGKRDKRTLIEYLDKHVRQMPRTMLRYAIEKLPEKERKYYLNLR